MKNNNPGHLRFSLIALSLVCMLFVYGCEWAPGADNLKILSCIPGNGERGVTETAVIRIEFNRSVKRDTLEEQFVFKTLSGSVNGSFSWISDKEFLYTPDSPLALGLRHMIEIPRAVRDAEGNPMAMDFLSDFYTGAEGTFLRVVFSDPPYTLGGIAGIATDYPAITVTFSEAMDIQKTETAFSLSPHVYGYFQWNAGRTVMEYRLTAPLEYGTRYTLNIAGTAEDNSGNSLGEAYSVIFFTVDDHAIPEILGIRDAAASPPPWWDIDSLNSGLSKNASIAVDFSKTMDRQSCEAAFNISPSAHGTYTWNASSTSMIFIPDEPLKEETVYTITIDASAKDENGRRLIAPYGLSIRTDAPDSLYVIIGSVWGSHDGGVADPYLDHLLFTTTPPWPVLIDMGPVAVPAAPISLEKDFYFMIQFLRSDNAPVAGMNLYSLFENVEINGQSNLTTSLSPFIKDILPGPTPDLVIIVIGDIDNSISINPPAIYRVIIKGHDTGISDINANNMIEDFVFDFQDQL